MQVTAENEQDSKEVVVMWVPGCLITAVPKSPFLNIAEDVLHQMTAFIDHLVVMQHEPGQSAIPPGHTAEHVVRSAVVAVTKAEVRPETIKVRGNGCIHVRRHLSIGGMGRLLPRTGNDLAPPVDHCNQHEGMPAVGGFVKLEQLLVCRVRR